MVRSLILHHSPLCIPPPVKRLLQLCSPGSVLPTPQSPLPHLRKGRCTPLVTQAPGVTRSSSFSASHRQNHAPHVPAPVSQALFPHEASTGLCAKHPKASPRKSPPPGSRPCRPSTPQKSSLLPASTGPADSDTISPTGRMGVSLACLLPLSLRAEL